MPKRIKHQMVLAYEIRKKTIKVKDSSDGFKKITRHGPVVNDLMV
jgi:hypothetical protein